MTIAFAVTGTRPPAVFPSASRDARQDPGIGLYGRAGSLARKSGVGDLIRHALPLAIVAMLALASCSDVDQPAVAPTTDQTAAAPQGSGTPSQEVAEPDTQTAVAAIEDMKRLAELGDAGAQYELALAYDIGSGVDRDARAARIWYLRAAAGGNREAQYKAGLLYEGGYTVPKDLGEALNWYRRAESQGHQLAARRVPELERAVAAAASAAIAEAQAAEIQQAVSSYERRDYDTAYREFSKLGERGNAGAQYYLGLMYDQGSGVPADPVRARRWYIMAASNGYADAQYKVGAMNEFGHLVARNPDAALTWYRQAAAQGHRLANRRVDELERTNALARGEAVPTVPSAVTGMAAPPERTMGGPVIGGSPETAGAPTTAIMSAVGEPSSSIEPATSPKNREPAPRSQTTKAPNTLIADVQAALAAYNHDENAGLIEKTRSLAEHGDPQAQYDLGVIYATGKGAVQDIVNAARWYRRAADHGHAEAQYALGTLYSEGRGVPRDADEAQRLYRSAARQGLVEAQLKLDEMVVPAASQTNGSQSATEAAATISPQQQQVETPTLISNDVLKEYRIGAGDRLAMTVFGHDDLSGEFLVDGSGRVSLPLLGQVSANDKTIAEFQTEVTKALDRDFIVNPRVSVEVINYRPFFILGQVNNPGSYSYIEGMTARMAVALAGGFTRRARESTVVVVRASDPEQKRTDVGLETPVLPGDTIEVERRLF